VLYPREADDPDDPLKKLLAYVCENEKCSMYLVRARDISFHPKPSVYPCFRGLFMT
jgi:hypothetical protein